MPCWFDDWKSWKNSARFFVIQRHRCNACVVNSWQSAFLWMHLHCQALAYTIKRALLARSTRNVNMPPHPTPPHPTPTHTRDLSSVATCNVVNNPRDLSSMAIYHVRSTRNVNMPPHPTPPHPTPPHPTPQSRYSKTCVLRERFSVRRHKQECMGYLSVCPLLDTGIPPCTFHPEIRWCHCPLFRSESVCQRTSTMSESHGKPWKKALVTLQRGGLWHRVCQSSVVFFFLFPSRPLALPSSADRALHLLVYGQGRWERIMGYLRYSSASFDQRRHVKLWNHVCRMTPAMLEYCISNDLEWSATGVHHV